ncbi:Probable amidase [Mycobacteroides abscessus subsp. abscessus]|nr:Probable amidase [Mycobacteroides abscessus subsp. abscessus]
MGQGTRTLLDMTVWIMRRPEDDIAAELEASSGPLAGVRLAVKDNVDVGGVPTTAACPEYAYVPDQDAPAVAALRAAGAVVVGKTNLDQFATGLVGTRSPYGAVSDSRRPEYISGGSSSGSAVAVATGQADIAIGTDTAGSGRVPAGLQGIVAEFDHLVGANLAPLEVPDDGADHSHWSFKHGPCPFLPISVSLSPHH